MHQHWSGPSFRPASEVFKILCLKGSAFEMGRQHGECLRDEIAYAIHRCIERFALSQQEWHRDALPIRRDGPPDNWTISSAVYEPDELKAHLAHGLLPASRGAFIEVSLSDLAGGPNRLICQPYGERVTELSREP
jgi:hypothetical protein